MNTNFAISVDWLQVCCFINPGEEIPIGKTLVQNGYEFEVLESSSIPAMFSSCARIKLGKFECATMVYNPRSKALKSNLCLIKVDNRFLYKSDYVKMLYALIEALPLRYHGITRLDLCYDCTHFYNGRNPGKFINTFISKPTSELGGISRKGSEHFIAVGDKSNMGVSKFQTCKFGSPKSRIVPQIYNKSAEMQAKKDKPWIREVWEKNGIQETKETPVWRTEISIKAQGMDIINMATGQLFRLSTNYLENQETIEALFYVYAEKYMFFRVNEGQKREKDFKRIDLFCKRPDITAKPIYINKSQETGRMERIMINKLEKLQSVYADTEFDYTHHIDETLKFLNRIYSHKESQHRIQQNESYLYSLTNRKNFDELDKEDISIALNLGALRHETIRSINEAFYGVPEYDDGSD